MPMATSMEAMMKGIPTSDDDFADHTAERVFSVLERLPSGAGGQPKSRP